MYTIIALARRRWFVVLALLLVAVTTAWAAVPSFKQMVKRKTIEVAVKEAVSCLAEDVVQFDIGRGRTAFGGLTLSAGYCARAAVNRRVFGAQWASAPETTRRELRDAARQGLQNPAELRATYLQYKLQILAEIRNHPELAKRLPPLLEDLRRYFVPGGVDLTVHGLLAARREAEAIRWGHILAKRDKELDIAYERLVALEERLRFYGNVTRMTHGFEWAQRRFEEGGAELVEAWGWIIGDLIEALK